MVCAPLTSSGRPFHTRQPEYLMLFLKYSVLGLGGTKQPVEDDLRLILVLALFLKIKFSDIYVGAILLYTLNINLAFLRWIRSYIDIIFKVFIASLTSSTLKSRIILRARFCSLKILNLLDSEELPQTILQKSTCGWIYDL